MAAEWMKIGEDGGHFRLAFDHQQADDVHMPALRRDIQRAFVFLAAEIHGRARLQQQNPVGNAR